MDEFIRGWVCMNHQFLLGNILACLLLSFLLISVHNGSLVSKISLGSLWPSSSGGALVHVFATVT